MFYFSSVVIGLDNINFCQVLPQCCKFIPVLGQCDNWLDTTFCGILLENNEIFL